MIERAAAVAIDAFVPMRWGRPPIALARSASISFMTLMKCAAIPKSAPPSHIHVGGVTDLESAIQDGSDANATAYGSGDKSVNLK